MCVCVSPGTSAVTLAPWPIPKGEQVWENYGQPNHIYFEFHGFSLPSNTHDCVRTALDVEGSDPQYAAKMKRLESEGIRYGSSNGQEACLRFPDKIDDDVLRFLAVKHSMAGGPAAVRTKKGRRKARSLLLGEVRDKLSGYPSGRDAKQDLALLEVQSVAASKGDAQAKMMSDNALNAVRFRMKEKERMQELIVGLEAEKAAHKAEKAEKKKAKKAKKAKKKEEKAKKEAGTTKKEEKEEL